MDIFNFRCKNDLKTQDFRKKFDLFCKNFLRKYSNLFSAFFQIKFSNFGQKTAHFTKFWQIKKKKPPKSGKKRVGRARKTGFSFFVALQHFLGHA